MEAKLKALSVIRQCGVREWVEKERRISETIYTDYTVMRKWSKNKNKWRLWDDITAPRLLTAVFVVTSRWLWLGGLWELRLTAVLLTDFPDVMLDGIKENLFCTQGIMYICVTMKLKHSNMGSCCVLLLVKMLKWKLTRSFSVNTTYSIVYYLCNWSPLYERKKRFLCLCNLFSRHYLQMVLPV